MNSPKLLSTLSQSTLPLVLFFLFTASIVLSLQCRHVSAKESGDKGEAIAFTMSLYRNAGVGEREEIDLKNRIAVTQGQEMQFVLQPEDDTYIYLYLFDTRKELSLLFPPAADYYGQIDPRGRTYHLPGEKKWFVVDDKPGTERIYVLAADRRIATLEQKTAEYLKNPEDKEAKAGLLGEIKRLYKQHSSLSSEVEQGVAIAGTIVKDVSATLEQENQNRITAKGFYNKTIRLIHE